MERQQNIRQASIRTVARNVSLSGVEIEQDEAGGTIIMVGTGPTFCPSCKNEKAAGISCCGIE